MNYKTSYRNITYDIKSNNSNFVSYTGPLTLVY